MNQQTYHSRRDALGLMAASAVIIASASVRTMAATPDPRDAEGAFLAAFAGRAEQPLAGAAARLAFLHEGALIVDHAVPFPMYKVGYADHLAFQIANLERLETRFHEIKTTRYGNTAIVTAYFIERSKPKDAGFRLRAGYCTAVCTWTSRDWQALSLHMSPMSSQIIDASPG